MKTRPARDITESIQVVRHDITAGLCDGSTLAHFEDIVLAYAARISLLERNLERMKLINGPEDKCVFPDNDMECQNHKLIRETEKAIAKAEGK